MDRLLAQQVVGTRLKTAVTQALASCCFIIVGVLLAATTSDAQTVTLRLDTFRPVIAPGEDILIDVYLENPGEDQFPIGGYQIGVLYPTDRVTLLGVPTPFADSELQNNFGFSAPSPIGTGFPSCPLWGDGLGNDVVTALGVMDGGAPFEGLTAHLFRLDFSTTSVAGESDTFGINNFEEFCAIWPSSLAVDPQGFIVPTLRQGVTVSVSSLPPVTGLICAPTQTSIELTWDDASAYDLVRIYRSGVLVSNHTPTETMFVDIGVLRGETYTYAAVGVIAGAEAPYSTCEVFMPFNVPAPTDLSCNLTATPGAISLTWQNPMAYDSIEVSRDGSLLATLSGVTQSYLDTTAGIVGSADYSVVGFEQTNPGPGATCTVLLSGQPFIRGDANSDGALNISDVTSALNHIFGITAQPCPDAIDFDDSGSLDVTDPVNMAQYLFVSGTPPPAPFPNLGVDPTPDALDCMMP